MANNTQRDKAADNFTRQVYDAAYATVHNNLGYASNGELIWAETAHEIELRVRAGMRPDRQLPDGTQINPFWYHSPIIER